MPNSANLFKKLSIKMRSNIEKAFSSYGLFGSRLFVEEA